MVAVGWKALEKRKEEIERKETMGNVDLGLWQVFAALKVAE